MIKRANNFIPAMTSVSGRKDIDLLMKEKKLKDNEDNTFKYIHICPLTKFQLQKCLLQFSAAFMSFILKTLLTKLGFY